MLGPDITYIGDKGPHDFDFSHIEGKHTVGQWLFEHFKRPDAVSPDTLMPDMHLNDQEALDLTRYMMSLHRKTMPASHAPVPLRHARVPADGPRLYGMFCSACHGEYGEGSTVRDPIRAVVVDVPAELMVPSLNHPDTLAVASDDYIRHVIDHGRPGTSMIAWGESAGGGLLAGELDRLVAHLRSRQRPGADRDAIRAARGEPQVGQSLYGMNCAACHGDRGEGGIGPSLNAPSFLGIASDAFFAETIVNGRPNTAMPTWRELDSRQVSDLISYIRSWQPRRNDPDAVLANLETAKTRAGGFLYAGICAGCHGAFTEGGVGTQLNNPVFLRSASDRMLREWITYGKLGTPMRGFRKGGQGMVELQDRQIDDLVAYLRSLERSPRVSVMRSPHGRPERGRDWYEVACASCHGPQGEGASGPALANPAFLQAASDEFLMATLALGRDGTEMRPVKKGPQSILSLTSDQVNDLVAFLRAWETDPPPEAIAHRFVIPWDLVRGERLYTSHCSGCHGVRGKAEIKDEKLSAWAPVLNNEGFLSAATDGFLQATIARGRAGTAMRPFGRGAQGLVDLSMEDIDDIVAYIRRWSTETSSPMTIPAELTVGTGSGTEGGEGPQGGPPRHVLDVHDPHPHARRGGPACRSDLQASCGRPAPRSRRACSSARGTSRWRTAPTRPAIGGWSTR